jgi:predicted hydrocarbon binding protein
MQSTPQLDGVVGIGTQALHAAREALLTDLGQRGAERLQEVGCAAGPEIYAAFLQWLPGHAGVDGPEDLDADRFADVLGAFFSALGWGQVRVDRLGSSGLAIVSDDWAEAGPGEHREFPSCHVTSGLLADFLTRMAGGSALAIMEVTCRSRGDAECRFIAGGPAALEGVYQALAEGRDYLSVFGSDGTGD